MLKILAFLDSDEKASARRRELDIPRSVAVELGLSAYEASMKGFYVYETSKRVDWSREVQAARASKISIPPNALLPTQGAIEFSEMCVQVTNETTLSASKRYIEAGSKPLALNFANGIHPGGGFLNGARSQEEVLCRSSALYNTIADDLMYVEHRQRLRPDSTDWAIYSPNVPVFRQDDGTELEHPWELSFITCAAPYAPEIGQPEAGDLLEQRIQRVLAIARAYQHAVLILGAWGCGAFGNDPNRTASDFRYALETEFSKAFFDIVFAIADWSPERKFLRPFCKAFSQNDSRSSRSRDSRRG